MNRTRSHPTVHLTTHDYVRLCDFDSVFVDARDQALVGGAQLRRSLCQGTQDTPTPLRARAAAAVG